MAMIVMEDSELRELIRQECMIAVREAMDGIASTNNVVRGIDNLANYLGVSRSTVKKWKRDGDLEGCYRQRGKTILFLVDKIKNKQT